MSAVTTYTADWRVGYNRIMWDILGYILGYMEPFMFFRKAPPQTEGRRHADPSVAASAVPVARVDRLSYEPHGACLGVRQRVLALRRLPRREFTGGPFDLLREIPNGERPNRRYGLRTGTPPHPGQGYGSGTPAVRGSALGV